MDGVPVATGCPPACEVETGAAGGVPVELKPPATGVVENPDCMVGSSRVITVPTRGGGSTTGEGGFWVITPGVVVGVPEELSVPSPSPPGSVLDAFAVELAAALGEVGLVTEAVAFGVLPAWVDGWPVRPGLPLAASVGWPVPVGLPAVPAGLEADWLAPGVGVVAVVVNVPANPVAVCVWPSPVADGWPDGLGAADGVAAVSFVPCGVLVAVPAVVASAVAEAVPSGEEVGCAVAVLPAWVSPSVGVGVPEPASAVGLAVPAPSVGVADSFPASVEVGDCATLGVIVADCPGMNSWGMAVGGRSKPTNPPNNAPARKIQNKAFARWTSSTPG